MKNFFFLVNFALFAQAWNREGVGSFVTGRSFVRRHRSALFFSPWPLLAGLPVFCPRWEAKQEEILTGTWEPKQQVPTAALQDTAGLGQESRAWSHGMLAFPFSASAPPHSLCHTTLFSPLSVTGGAIFPNAVEEQPPPPTRNLLQL